MEDKLNEAAVKALPVPAKGAKIHNFAGAKIQGSTAPRGFGVRVTARGVRSFVLRYWNPAEHLIVIGQYPDWKPLTAVNRARELRQQIDRGEDPLGDRRKQESVTENTFQAICEEYFRRDGSKLRTKADRQHELERLAYPRFGDMAIEDIRRTDIIRLLDDVADEHGEVMADRLLAYVRRVMRWHASRSDTYSCPVVPGMAKTKSKERSRQRILSDDEIKAVWQATEGSTAPFHRLVRFILLTGCRRSEASLMTWDELVKADWTLPPQRNKTGLPLLRPLSKAALAALPAKVDGSKWIFTTDGQHPISGFSKFRAALYKASGTSGWTLHDCRRTSRTLLSRAGVNADVAERCLGHVIGGVRGVYDRWEFRDEKAAAYKALAALIDRIINPPAGNVEDLGERRRKGAA